MRRSRLWPGPRATTSACRSRKRVSQRRELDALREQPALVAEVPHRVLGERLERLRDARLLLVERLVELAARRARGRPRAHVAVPVDVRAADRDVLAVGDVVEEVAPGASIRRTPPRTSSSGPGFGIAPGLPTARR